MIVRRRTSHEARVPVQACCLLQIRSYVYRSRAWLARIEVCMSELWFDCEGNPIDVPPEAVGWHVRRVVARGRPQLVYDGDGLPLFLPIGARIGELRRAVGGEG